MKKNLKTKIQQIAITGGKGGTGKSTFSVLLAKKYLNQRKKVILVDCDVECPNDYLLLGQKLTKSRKEITANFPKLNKSRCQKCGKCLNVCRSHAIFLPPKKYPIFLPELCSGCGACWTICPNQAIQTKKIKTGQIYINKVNPDLFLITGLVKPGLEETGPVVRQTKKFALKFAKNQKAQIILFDTAPGTHCPVISALLDVDFAYAVTEPTPMGAYDLNLILDLCKKLKVPVKVVLNQANLGNKKIIQKILKKHQKKIQQEIPYSQKLAQVYSKGELLNFQFTPPKRCRPARSFRDNGVNLSVALNHRPRQII